MIEPPGPFRSRDGAEIEIGTWIFDGPDNPTLEIEIEDHRLAGSEPVATFDLAKLPAKHRGDIVTALAGDPRVDPAAFTRWRAAQRRLRVERGALH